VELLADPRRLSFEAIIAVNFDNNNPIAAANTIVVTLKPFTSPLNAPLRSTWDVTPFF